MTKTLRILPPGAATYFAATTVVSGAVGTCIINTASYTGTTPAGTGQMPQTDWGGPFGSIAYEVGAADTAQVCFADVKELFLPVLLREP